MKTYIPFGAQSKKPWFGPQMEAKSSYHTTHKWRCLLGWILQPTLQYQLSCIVEVQLCCVWPPGLAMVSWHWVKRPLGLMIILTCLGVSGIFWFQVAKLLNFCLKPILVFPAWKYNEANESHLDATSGSPLLVFLLLTFGPQKWSLLNRIGKDSLQGKKVLLGWHSFSWQSEHENSIQD